MGLIFHVNSRRSALDKHLSELHYGGEAAMAGISVGNDGTEKVDEGRLCAFFGGHIASCGALFAIMKKLGHEQVFDLTQVSLRLGLLRGR